MMHLEYEETFAGPERRQLDNGYFEGLIKTYLLDNPYEALVICKPEAEPDRPDGGRKLQRSWQNIRTASPTTRSLDLVRQTKELKEYQDTPVPEGGAGEDPAAGRRDEIGREPRS